MKYEIVQILKNINLEQTIKLDLKNEAFDSINRNEEVKKKIFDYEINKIKNLNNIKNNNIQKFTNYIFELNKKISQKINENQTYDNEIKEEIKAKKKEKLEKIKLEDSLLRESNNYSVKLIEEKISKSVAEYKTEKKNLSIKIENEIEKSISEEKERLNSIESKYTTHFNDINNKIFEIKHKIDLLNDRIAKDEAADKENEKDNLKIYNNNINLLKNEYTKKLNLEITLHETHLQELNKNREYYITRYQNLSTKLKKNSLAKKELVTDKKIIKKIDLQYDKERRLLEQFEENYETYYSDTINYYNEFINITKEDINNELRYKLNSEKHKLDQDIIQRKNKTRRSKIQLELIKARFEKNIAELNEKRTLYLVLKELELEEVKRKRKDLNKSLALKKILENYYIDNTYDKKIKIKELEIKYSNIYSDLIKCSIDKNIELIEKESSLKYNARNVYNQIKIEEESLKILLNNYKLEIFKINENLINEIKKIDLKLHYFKKELILLASLISTIYRLKTKILKDEKIKTKKNLEEVAKLDGLIIDLIYKRTENIKRSKTEFKINEVKEKLQIETKNIRKLISDYNTVIFNYRNERLKEKVKKNKLKHIRAYLKEKAKYLKLIENLMTQEKIKYHFYFELISAIKQNKSNINVYLKNFFNQMLGLIVTSKSELYSNIIKKYNKQLDVIRKNLVNQYIVSFKNKENLLIKINQEEKLFKKEREETGILELEKNNSSILVKSSLIKESYSLEKMLTKLINQHKFKMEYYNRLEKELEKNKRINNYRKQLKTKTKSDRLIHQKINKIYNKDRNNKLIEKKNIIFKNKEMLSRQSVERKDLTTGYLKQKESLKHKLDKLKRYKEKEDVKFYNTQKLLNQLKI